MTIINKPRTLGDPYLEIALGNVSNYTGVNKFGRANDCDSGLVSDIWDGSDGLTSTHVWVPPTQARVHAIVSSDAEDATGGDGINMLIVQGLTSWDATEETTEVVAMAGQTPVNTTNSWVIIHRMRGMTYGVFGTNAGIIKATAAVDATVTAAIQIGNGQTLMAIYGVAAGHRFAISHLHMDMIGNAVKSGTGRLMVETRLDTGVSGERIQREWNLTPQARYETIIHPPIVMAGPAIIKMQIITDVSNTAATGSFDGVLAATQHPDHG